MSKEYVIWGVPKGRTEEEVLLATPGGKPIESMALARKFVKVLEQKYGATRTRIQVIDLSGEFDWMKSTGLMARELLAMARELEAARPTDNTGEPIRPVGKYVLVWKRGGYGYFVDGTLHAPHFTKDIDEAWEFGGDRLLAMAYDWTMNWSAISTRFL